MPKVSLLGELCNSVNEEMLIKRMGCVDKDYVVKRFLRELFLALSYGEEVHIRGFGKFYLDINSKRVIFENDENSKVIKAGIRWITSGIKEDDLEIYGSKE